jgi:hypothetical protein
VWWLPKGLVLWTRYGISTSECRYLNNFSWDCLFKPAVFAAGFREQRPQLGRHGPGPGGCHVERSSKQLPAAPPPLGGGSKSRRRQQQAAGGGGGGGQPPRPTGGGGLVHRTEGSVQVWYLCFVRFVDPDSGNIWSPYWGALYGFRSPMYYRYLGLLSSFNF